MNDGAFIGADLSAIFAAEAAPTGRTRSRTSLGSGLLDNQFQTLSTTAFPGGMLRSTSSIRGVVCFAV